VRSAPAAATWLLEQFSSSAEHESVTGDLLEQYHVGRGRFWYWWQVLAIVFIRLYRGTARRPTAHKYKFPVRPGFAALLLLVAVYVAMFVFQPWVPDAVAVILLIVVPLGTLGAGTVHYWVKLRPCVFQTLGLLNRKAAKPIRSVRGLGSVLPIVLHR